MARPLTLADRVELLPAAIRRVGTDVFISAFGAAGAVERLPGRGRELWELLAAGSTLAEAAATLSERTGAPLDTVEPRVLELVDLLQSAGVCRVSAP